MSPMIIHALVVAILITVTYKYMNTRTSTRRPIWLVCAGIYIAGVLHASWYFGWLSLEVVLVIIAGAAALTSLVIAIRFKPKKKGANISAFDPFIGCPFDDSEMDIVHRHDNHTVGDRVQFKGPNDLHTTHHPILQGTIFAIGRNARYLDGTPFTALVVKVGDVFHLKTASEVSSS